MLFFSLLIGKIIFWLNRLTGSGGSALPGLVVEKLNPHFISVVANRNFQRGVILVTGTNGKTTTSKMIAAILEKAGLSYLHNKAGSNLSRGVASALIAASNWRGQIKADIGLFEVDEAAIRDLALILNPRIIVVINLFRDQLDRYGELDKTAQSLAKTFSQIKSTICLNSDDPLVAGLSLTVDKNQVIFFGVSDYHDQFIDDLQAIDVTHSPKSKAKLIYDKRYFGHLGIYRSANSDFNRPKPQIELTKTSWSIQYL